MPTKFTPQGFNERGCVDDTALSRSICTRRRCRDSPPGCRGPLAPPQLDQDPHPGQREGAVPRQGPRGYPPLSLAAIHRDVLTRLCAFRKCDAERGGARWQRGPRPAAPEGVPEQQRLAAVPRPPRQRSPTPTAARPAVRPPAQPRGGKAAPGCSIEQAHIYSNHLGAGH